MMAEQRTPLFDIFNTIAKIPHSLLQRIRIIKRNKSERQKAEEDLVPMIEQLIPLVVQLIPVIEQLFENEASKETIKQSEGKTPKRLTVKTLKKSKKKKTYADINLAAKIQRKLLRENSDSTPEIRTKSMISVQDNKPTIDAQLPTLYPQENVVPNNTNNSLNHNPKINNEKLPQPLLKTVQNKHLMKTVSLIIPEKKAIENKSSIVKNRTSNQKNEKIVQSHSPTNTKPSKKKRPKTLLKKSVQQKKRNFKSFNPLNEVQYTDQYLYSIIDDL